MKIIQFIPSLKGRGAERVCIDLHEGFLRAGYDSKIYITHNIVEFPIDKKYVEYIEVANIEATILQEDFDLLIGHMTHTAKVLRNMKKDPRIFFVIHTTISAKLKKMSWKARVIEYLKLQLIYRGAKVVTVSDWVRKDLSLLKIKPSYVKTIYNPFDFNRIELLATTPIGLDSSYIIAVGSLEPVKRYDLLLRAYASLQPKESLLILGMGSEERKLHALADTLGISHKVQWLGWVENPYKYIKRARLFVQTSDIEGLPGVVIESLILKTPVVATDCPSGIREIIPKELSGYLAKVGDYKDIADKIKQALDQYPQIEREKLEKFRLEVNVAKYLKLMQEEKILREN